MITSKSTFPYTILLIPIPIIIYFIQIICQLDKQINTLIVIQYSFET